MELVNAVLDDSIPSTGEPIPYFHSFFRMSDGSTVAFFEAPGAAAARAAAASRPTTPSSTSRCRSTASTTSTAGTRWLGRHGVEVLGPVDHKIIYSIYFHDPNGIRLEITTPTSTDVERQRRAAARASLADWADGQGSARASAGDDMVTVLKELAARAEPPALVEGSVDPEDRQRRRPRRRAGARVGALAARASTATAGPKVVRRGIRDIDYVGTASYVEHFDDDSPTKVDCWIYEDLVYTHKRMVAAAGYPQGGDDPHADHLRRHAARVATTRRRASTTWT